MKTIQITLAVGDFKVTAPIDAININDYIIEEPLYQLINSYGHELAKVNWLTIQNLQCAIADNEFPCDIIRFIDPMDKEIKNFRPDGIVREDVPSMHMGMDLCRKLLSHKIKK